MAVVNLQTSRWGCCRYSKALKKMSWFHQAFIAVLFQNITPHESIQGAHKMPNDQFYLKNNMNMSFW